MRLVGIVIDIYGCYLISTEISRKVFFSYRKMDILEANEVHENLGDSTTTLLNNQNILRKLPLFNLFEPIQIKLQFS